MKKKGLIFAVAVVIGGVAMGVILTLYNKENEEVYNNKTGIEMLEGTTDIDIFQQFSLSPDDSWLFYPSLQSTPSSPKFIIYNIKEKTKFEITLDQEVRNLAIQGRVPFYSSGCWDTKSLRVFIPGSAGHDLFFVDLESKLFTLQFDKDSDTAKHRYYLKCLQLEFESTFKIVNRSDREVWLVDNQNPQKAIAKYSTWNPFRNRVTINDLSFSPNGRYFVYGVTFYTGSFTGKTKLYLVDTSTNKNPLLIDNSMGGGPLIWSSDGNWLYGTKSYQDGIFRWDMNRLSKKNSES